MAIKVSGVWKNQVSTNVKVGGTWKAAASGWVRLSGVWREFVANTLSLSYADTAFAVRSVSQTKSPTVSGGYTSQAKTFALVSGSLPSGVTLNTSNGILTGPSSWSFPAVRPTVGTGNFGVVAGITATSDGGAIVLGTFSTGTVVFGSTTLTLAGATTIFVAKISSTGSWVWATANTGTGTCSNPAAQNPIIGTSDGGAIIFAAVSTASVTFGSTTLTPSGTNNPLAAKISSTGSWVWANSAQTSVTALSVTATSDGSAIVFGSFAGATAVFGSTTLTNTSGQNIFVAKISSVGAWSWASQSTGSGRGQGVALQATSDGGAIITGVFNTASIVFGSITLPLAGASTALFTTFVVKISSTGSWSWGARNTGSGQTLSQSLTVTSDDGAIICGNFSTAATTFGSTTLPLIGTTTTFVAKVSSTGSWVWANSNGGTGNCTSGQLIVGTSDGGAIISSRFSTGPITFGSTTLTVATANTMFVAKVSSTGSWVWATQNTGSGNLPTHPARIVGTSDGGAIISSRFITGSITFGSTTLALAGANTMFIAKVSSTGSWVWANSNTGAGSVGGNAQPMVLMSDGSVVAGSSYTTNSISFGTIALSLVSTISLYIANITSSGIWGEASTFPRTVTISATDSSGTATTTPTLTAV